MSPRTAFLSKLVGLYGVVIALALFANKQMLVVAVTGLYHDSSIVLIYGVMALGIGLAMVLGHNVWSGTPAIIITIIGWLALLKGLALLFLPASVQAAYFLGIQYNQYFYAYAAVTLVVGLYLSYEGFSAGQRHS